MSVDDRRAPPQESGDARSDAAPMGSPRAAHAAVTLADRRVLVVGGATQGAAMDPYVRTTEVYGELP